MGEADLINYEKAVEQGALKTTKYCRLFLEKKFGKSLVDQFDIVTTEKKSKLLRVVFFRSLLVEKLKLDSENRRLSSITCYIGDHIYSEPSEKEQILVMGDIEMRAYRHLKTIYKGIDSLKKSVTLSIFTQDEDRITYWHNSVHFSLNLNTGEHKMIGHGTPNRSSTNDIDLRPIPAHKEVDPWVEWKP